MADEKSILNGSMSFAGTLRSLLKQKTIQKRRPSDERAVSAFFLYLTSIRAELQAESKSGSEQANVAGEKWKALSPKEKANFIDEAGSKRKAIRQL